MTTTTPTSAPGECGCDESRVGLSRRTLLRALGLGSAMAVAVFVVIGSLTVVGPVTFYLLASSSAAGPLDSIKTFLSAHNAGIMMVLFLVLGAKLLGQGLGGLG